VTKVAFEPWHLVKIPDMAGPRRNDDSLLAWGVRQAQFLPNVTFMVGDVPMACGGLGVLHEGVAEVWLAMSSRVGPHLVREVRGQLEEWIVDLHLHRVQTVVDASFEQGCAFVQRVIGMELEGVLRCMGPDREDYVLYARVIDGTRSR